MSKLVLTCPPGGTNFIPPSPASFELRVLSLSPSLDKDEDEDEDEPRRLATWGLSRL